MVLCVFGLHRSNNFGRWLSLFQLVQHLLTWLDLRCVGCLLHQHNISGQTLWCTILQPSIQTPCDLCFAVIYQYSWHTVCTEAAVIRLD